MRVYVTTRYCQDFALTLGVFSSPATAKEYVESMAEASSDSWSEPAPGHQHWELQREGFTYAIEEHCLRT